MTKLLFHLFLLLLTFPIKAAEKPLKETRLNNVSNVFINELMSSNNIYTDEHDEADDWLELYNANDTAVVLTGLYLSDDDDNLTKWQITTAISIPPNGFALFWLDDQIDQGDYHLPFKLSKDGETVFLSQMEGGDIVVIDEVEFPEMAQNTSYGRLPDGVGDWVNFGDYSPMQSNNGGGLFFETVIDFSKTSGSYENTVTVEITCADPTAEIRWTVDNSIPNENSNIYNNSFTIEETTLVRAAAFKAGYSPTAFSEAFYLVNEDHTLPVIQFSVDPKFLWSDEEGMYVTGTNGIYSGCTGSTHNWNQRWERPATIRYIKPEGDLAFKVNAGIKIGGACSRKVSMKPFTVFLREDTYGDEEVDYKMFSTLEIQKFNRFKLRASGSDFSYTRLRDAAIQSILYNQLDMDLMAYQPVVLYLNGEYWGFYALREFYGRHYIETHHGVDQDNIDYIKIPYFDPGIKEGDAVDWEALTTFIRNNDLADEENYNMVTDWIDINEFINYYITEIYIANYDWPANNISVWRSRDNGKWRWKLYDLDWSSGYSGPWKPVFPSTNSIDHATTATEEGWPNGEPTTLFLRKLLENKKFRDEFNQRSCTIAQTVFAPQRTNHFIDSLVADVAGEMPATLEKFNNSPAEWRKGHHQVGGGSMETWKENLDLFKGFFEKRFFHVINHYQNHFGFSGNYTLTLNFDEESHGKVLLHKNEMSVPFQYARQYFNEVPITLKAVPDEGYYFVRWKETGDTSALIEFVSAVDTLLTPIFLENGTSIIGDRPYYKVFPNPVSDYMYLQYGDLDNNEITVRVYNVLGQEVYRRSMASSTAILEHPIYVGAWQRGVYFVHTEIGGELFSTKVMVGE